MATMKDTTKLSLILWILVGFNLAVFLTGFKLSSSILKRLSAITENNHAMSDATSDMKVMIETFGDLFHSFSICGLVFTVCWVLLVRKCMATDPPGKTGA